MTTRDEILEIEFALRVSRASVADFLESAGVPVTTWYRLKRGDASPRRATWEKVLAEVQRRKLEVSR